METKQIKNSSGKNIGTIEKYDDKIIIKNNTKPDFVINDKEIIEKINHFDFQVIPYLYDEYTLTVGEIAALFNKCYSNINRHLKTLKLKTNKKSGRRNSSYGKKFSEERIHNMVINRKDDHKQLKGRIVPEEQRKKISETLKRKYRTGEIKVNKEKIRQRWKEGRYENVDFGHGIGGHFTSLKNNKRFFFRSLLELYFLLKIEDDPKVSFYEYESIRIVCENGKIYTPDFLINNTVVELKSKKYIENMPLEVKNNFLYKKEQAEKYCQKNGLEYKVIFDEDLGFESKKMKTFLRNNPEIITKYQITFVNPERVFSQKK